ncbi:MAG: hypothetical protein U1E84_06125 [Rhodoferax sp.]
MPLNQQDGDTPPKSLVAEHRDVQNAAKSVLANLASEISAFDTEEPSQQQPAERFATLVFPKLGTTTALPLFSQVRAVAYQFLVEATFQTPSPLGNST